ncbi:MAG: SdrD B-like domain-containing protein [Chloroflexota bacterium]
MVKKGLLNNNRHWYRLMTSLVIMALVITGQASLLTTNALAQPSQAGAGAPSSKVSVNAPAQAPSLMMLSVRNIETLAGISEYKYLINVDNTGDPLQDRNAGCSPADPGYPDSCDWPSIRAVPGAAPIFTQGDQSDFGGGLSLPPGKYLVTVLADGFKLGGKHFVVSGDGSPLNVLVELNPHPLPDATMRIKVFNDNASVNGQVDFNEPGLEGFRAIVNDIAGQITTDIYGNSLCTMYDLLGNPIGVDEYGCLISDANGDMVIPHLGTQRFDVNVTPPVGSGWIQTTTLEGSHSWDTWLAEGGTGLDNEFVIAGEPFPWTVFGFVQPTNTLAGGTGGIKGTIVNAAVYVPRVGGVPYYGAEWSGLNGNLVTGPTQNAWVALSDLQNGDQVVYAAPADPTTGYFEINGVPDGDYFFTYWDFNQEYILNWTQVTVANGQMVDLGTPFLTGWFTWVEGYVFNDLNSNGKRDPGEPGVSDYLVVLKDRDNTEIDRMTIAVTTDHNGYYRFDRAYPLGSWMILEAYSDRHYTTGFTYQVENQPEETTILGAGVDVGVLPNLGQTGRLDWGVRAYAPGTNGGIAGTVFYDTTRNELDPRFQAVEGWAPGIPNLRVNVYKPVACGTTAAPCDATGMYELAPDGSIAKDMTAGGVACGTTPGADCDPSGTWELDGGGNFKVGPVLNTALTEQWEQPIGCTPRDADGNPWINTDFLPVDYLNERCLEAPQIGLQFQNDFASLDGNYGFGSTFSGFGSAVDPVETAMAAGDYLVETVIPEDALGRPMYKVVREEDINVFGGDEFAPQIPPPACAGPLHTVDVAGILPDGPNATVNPAFVDAGGSPYEGMDKPLCNVKLVTVSSGRSIAPGFTLFTDVPIPGKWKGYIISDLALSTVPQDLMYGEKAGVPHSPIGIYDFANHLVTTITSDPNGVYEVLLPSTYSINCASPSGVCPAMYYMLGNDPGQPGALNPNYDPQFRTIGATFEIWPGVMLPSDLAPTQAVNGILAPGSNQTFPPACYVNDPANPPIVPELYAISKPYNDGGAAESFTIQGQGFGSSGAVLLDETMAMAIASWSATSITFSVPGGTPAGPHQLSIVNGDNGNTTVNGLTFHVFGAGYSPTVRTVGPGRDFDPASYPAFPGPIQAALDAAAASPGDNLVVVYPGTPVQWNPYGTYFENLLLYASVKLQGVGPGGGNVLGSRIDGRGVAGDDPYAEDWRVFAESLTWDGNQAVYEGPVIYVAAEDGEFGSAFAPAIDGFTITGGDQQGFPNQIVPADPTVHQISSVQGGGIFVNAYANFLEITNNVLESNGGAYGGSIRIGTPHLPGASNDNQNDNLFIAHNRVIASGGVNLAGAIGIFSGAENYEVAFNDVCGNFSAEYGGGISHYGLSPNGSIHDNRVYFNRSYDEGGGIFIAGELPTDPNLLSAGAGPVDVYNNLIQANLANDDGGGLRFLMAGNFEYNVYNNVIVNNVSTHEGGGVSLNDAPNVRFFNNTVMKNITTSTAITSNGAPVPAGLSTSLNSQQLQATLPGGSPLFSDPLMFNNIFWDNRAGSWSPGVGILGIGIDPGPINYWDMGVTGGFGSLSPTDTLMQTTLGTTPDGSNIVGVDPDVVSTFDVSVAALPWRGNPNFVDTLMVVTEVPVNLMGDYHINQTSPAFNTGASSKSGVNAPSFDVDNDPRPQMGAWIDMGADEIAGQLPADIAVAMTDDKTIVYPGETVTYDITVTNPGPVDVLGATVADAFSSNFASVNWTCSASAGSSCSAANGTGDINLTIDILMGGSITIQAVGQFSSAPVGLSYTNTVTAAVSSGYVDANPGDNSATDTNDIGQVTDLSITKDDGLTTVYPGDTYNYTITVANSGPADVFGATVTDVFPADLTSVTWTCAATNGTCGSASGSGNIGATVDLLVGGTATFDVTVTLSASATSGSTIANTAEVSAPALGYMDPNLANNSATDTDTIGYLADLSVVVTDTVTHASIIYPGDTVHYQIVITNNGPSDVTGAMVEDTFDPIFASVDWTCSASAGSGCSAASGAGNINITVDLLSGGTATIVANAHLPSEPQHGTSYDNTVSVSMPDGYKDTNPADNIITDTNAIGEAADLSVAMSDGITSAFPGDPVSYTITVTNNGPDDAPGATFSDTFSADLTGVTWTCSASAGSACGAASGSGDINTTLDLLAGGSATFQVSAQLSSNPAGSSFANTATADAPAGVFDPNLLNNSASDTNAIGSISDLAVTLSDAKTFTYPGETVSYTIVVTNGGPDDVFAASVIDAFSANFTSVDWTCSASAGSVCGAASGSGDINTTVDLLAGGSATFQVSAQFSTSPAAGPNYSNTVDVAVPTGYLDPDLLNNTASDTNAIERRFPRTPFRDRFNRDNTTSGLRSNNWIGDTGSFHLANHRAENLSAGEIFWQTGFGSDQEAYFTFNRVSQSAVEQGLYLKYNDPNPNNPDPTRTAASWVSVTYRRSNGRLLIRSKLAGTNITQTLANLPATFVNGNRLGARVLSNGLVLVYKRNGDGWTLIGIGQSPNTGGGRIGITVTSDTMFARNRARFDDFGGGNLP